MPSTASRFFMRARQGTITSLVETRSAMFAVVRQVIFLNGPIGAGKTTLGRALANDLCAAFLDSDDLRDRSKRWYEETLTLANALVRAGTSALTERPLLVIAMPLRARLGLLLRAVPRPGDHDLLRHPRGGSRCHSRSQAWQGIRCGRTCTYSGNDRTRLCSAPIQRSDCR